MSKALMKPADALRFGVYTTAAALMAMIVAYGLGFHHPWWAAMTVWLVAQPTRGLLVERAAARLAGTVIGAGVGHLILIVLAPERLPMLGALACWLAFCAAGGSLFRHFRSYAFVLAGYSAAIVILFGFGPVGGGEVAVDRTICTLIGIGCAMVLAVRRTTKTGAASITVAFEALVGGVLDHLAGAATADREEALLREIVAIDRQLDSMAAGSAGEHAIVRRFRHAMGVLIEILAFAPVGGAAADLRAQPDDIASRLRQSIERARCAGRMELLAVLDELVALMDGSVPTWRLRERWAVVDLRRVTRAALRPIVALAMASAIWLGSNWQDGATMTMTAVLFATLFSSHGQGSQAVLHALAGATLGAIAGTAYRLFVFPHVDGIALVTVAVLPILLGGAWMMCRRTTAKLAIDLNMTFLLAAQPMGPTVPWGAAVGMSAAIIAGLLIAMATFHLILPASAATSTRILRRRARRLTAALIRHRDSGTTQATRLALRATIRRQLDTAGPDVRLVDLLLPLRQWRHELANVGQAGRRVTRPPARISRQSAN